MKTQILICITFALAVAVARGETESSKADIVLVDDIAAYHEQHPDEVLVELERPKQQPRVGIRYTLGGRVSGDGLVAQKSDYTSYAGPRDVQLTLTYPTSGTGAVVTYVQVDVNQSTNVGRGYVAAGGIGQRYIKIVIEARGTTYFQYNALIYGSLLNKQLHQHGFNFKLLARCTPMAEHRDWVWYERLNTYFMILIIKMIEFLETIMFILRKKFKQVTVLHVYHHVSSVLLTWYTFKVSSDMHECFLVTINSYVHIMMYFYYFLSLFEGFSKKLIGMKHYLTMIQIIQFGFCVIHIVTAVKPSCHVHKKLFWFHLINQFINIFLFFNFYRQSYSKPNPPSRNHKKRN